MLYALHIREILAESCIYSLTYPFSSAFFYSCCTRYLRPCRRVHESSMIMLMTTVQCESDEFFYVSNALESCSAERETTTKNYPVNREILLILFIIISPHSAALIHRRRECELLSCYSPTSTECADIIKGSQILIICRLRIWIWPFNRAAAAASRLLNFQSTFHSVLLLLLISPLL